MGLNQAQARFLYVGKSHALCREKLEMLTLASFVANVSGENPSFILGTQERNLATSEPFRELYSIKAQIKQGH